jgi:hypothetical protein
VSASSAIRWLDRLKKQGDVAAKRPGGDRKSGRIEAEAAFLLCEVAETPDITLVELQKKLQARGVSAGIGTLWRLFVLAETRSDRRCLIKRSDFGVRRCQAAIIFSFAIGIASRNVCIGVLPKHQRP